MMVGWIRIGALIGVAALFANVACYAQCVTAACDSSQAPSNSCHHQKSSQSDPASCPYQRYSEVSSPEAGIAKIVMETAAILTLPVLTQDAAALAVDPRFPPHIDNSSPPGGKRCSSISVLRI